MEGERREGGGEGGREEGRKGGGEGVTPVAFMHNVCRCIIIYIIIRDQNLEFVKKFATSLQQEKIELSHAQLHDR